MLQIIDLETIIAQVHLLFEVRVGIVLTIIIYDDEKLDEFGYLMNETQ